jgi:PPOX class probable FMN-dependent enzyme
LSLQRRIFAVLGAHAFHDTIHTEAELRGVIGEPGGVALGKQLDRLDRHCRSFIALSPLVLVGTFDPDGACDVSPRGDAAGFVLVLDDKTLAIPERPGNRRLDSLLNVLETGSVGLLFLVPGFEETLRVNGRAWVVRDAGILERTAARDKPPAVAIGVEVEECFLHCAKAFKRSEIWRPEGWPERSALPSLGRMFRDQGAVPGVSSEELDRRIGESYAKRLY